VNVPSRLESFDAVWDAYAALVEDHVEALAIQERIEYDICAKEAPFLFFSMLYDDCIDRQKPIFGGGVRHLGGTLETYGNSNTADALTAINRLVFEERRFTLDEVVAACDANFVGFENVRQALLAAPKYGNDDPEADAMAARVHEHVCATTRAQAAKVGLDSYLVVVINNRANTTLGRQVGASADGRVAFDSMANGNNPSPGSDHAGATAFLNSLVKLDTRIHAGAVQNMKFSSELFARHRVKLEALLNAYWTSGGAQAMITVLDRHDLEAAMAEPEKWGHLLVRVGGFSIRFVDLSRQEQEEILRRTLHS
jgi:pyruvate-formate lyase